MLTRAHGPDCITTLLLCRSPSLRPMVIRVAFDRMDASVSLYFGPCKPRLRHLASCRYLSIHLSYLSIYRRSRCLLIEFFTRKKKKKDRRSEITRFNDKRMQREFSRFKRCEVEQGFILYRIGHSFLASSRDQCGRCETFGTSRSRPPRPSIRSLLDPNPIVPIGRSSYPKSR